MRILVTGGAGFIGSHLVRKLIKSGHVVLNVDVLTYAANPACLQSIEGLESYSFLKRDICDCAGMKEAFQNFSPDAVFHLAAESHVDRSISTPHNFLNTNINGTFSLLEGALSYWEDRGKPDSFRFIHISTDEVYGSLQMDEAIFDEFSQYLPNSPYAASKAASDHLVRAWFKTYGLPSIITHSSNNFGPCQHKEKLIPTMIHHALLEKTLPIYGTGKNIRDWIYVGDHVDGLLAALERGTPGDVYNFGGGNEISNLDLVRRICVHLDIYYPRALQKSYADLISFVEDRKGHDFRYANNNEKAQRELKWTPKSEFDSALAETINWYASKQVKEKL